MFRRREPESPGPDFPLSGFQARRLHQLVAAAFEDAGVVVRSAGDRVVDGRGRGFGLRDLAAECAVEPVGRWPGLVRRHVDRAVAPPPTLDQLTEHTLVSSCALRLVPVHGLPEGWDPEAPRLTDDLTSVVTVQRGDEALTPSAAALAERAPHVPWRHHAGENLRRLAHDLDLHQDRVEPAGEPEAGFDVLVGESGLVASTALVLEEVLERIDRRDVGRGVLVGVPYRHQVVLHVVDGPGARRSVGHLADYVGWTHAVAPGPVSPLVHWVRDGAWLPVTRAGDDGATVQRRLAEAPDPEVAAALGI